MANFPFMGNQVATGYYAQKVIPTGVFYRAECTKTSQAVIKQGQVLKAHTFLMSDSAGKLIAHSGFNESAIATFAALTSGQTLIAGGITFTAGASGATASQAALAWSSIDSGDTSTSATTKIAAAGITAAIGTFSSGTFTGWETEAGSVTGTVVFNSTTPITNPTDIAFTGTGTAPTLQKVQGATSFATIAGVLVYDVDATSTDIEAPVYKEASFFLEALVWSVNPNTDFILKADGVTQVACTTYNTGCDGTSTSSDLLKQKFVEGSEFSNLGPRRKAGELF